LPTTAARAGWAGIPAEDRKAARRVRLLDAAFELLGSEGWSATTVRAVCQAAQLNPRYFYESFEDLDGLVVAVYDRTVEELAGVVFGTADAAGPDPASQVQAVLERIVDFVADDPRRGRVLYVEALGNEALNRRRIEAGHQLVVLLERGAAERFGRPPEGERIGRIAAAFLVGGFGELLRGWLDGRIDVPKAQLVDDASALFLAIGEAADRIATSRATRPPK
jgi:AcrR family transcriptional regulator